LLPGWGWWGLALAATGLLAITTQYRPLPLLGFAVLWLLSILTWTPPTSPEGWTAIDTEFRGAEGRYADYQQQLDTLALVVSSAKAGASTIVLPESALGAWTPTVERLWRDGLRGFDVIVLAGAVVIRPEGYDNVVLELTSGSSRVLYRQRMPVPVSMWRPWQDYRNGSFAGARAYFFQNPLVHAAGTQITSLVCYEQLLIWPVIHSMLNGSNAIVAVGNGWWTTGTPIVEIQRAATQAWARLFDTHLVFAFNR
jgi:apolipoprotein N-acyltransferase